MDPDDVEVKAVTVGTDSGVSLKWASTESGTRSFELKIICGTTSVVGPATSGNSPVVEWKNPGVCDGPTPGGGGGGGGGDAALEWGAFTLIGLSVSAVLYLGGGTYSRQSKAGNSGTACFSGLSSESLPNAEFWGSLPAYVRDGVRFSRTQIGSVHPALSWIAPSDKGEYEDVEKAGLVKGSDGQSADAKEGGEGGSEEGRSSRRGRKEPAKKGGREPVKKGGKEQEKGRGGGGGEGRRQKRPKGNKPKPKPRPAAPGGRPPSKSAME